MVRFTASIRQFKEQGEKTGWTYIEIPADIAEQINPGCKKSFRVKGKLDDYRIEKTALLPMGGGSFILPLNATIRKNIHKGKGAMLNVQMAVDQAPLEVDKELMECLADEPAALSFFGSLPRSHQLYFSKWISSAKTAPTKAKRIAQAVSALAKKWGFQEMMRANRELK